MQSEPFLSQQVANQHVETWKKIDPRRNSLLGKKLGRANRKTADKIKKQALKIRIANRLNCNPDGTELQILDMWEEETKRLAEEYYAILCKEWEEVQGNKRTAIFVRGALAQLMQVIERWGCSAAHGARVLRYRRGGIGKSLEGSYKDRAQKLRKDWEERLDIEAGDLHKQETAQRRKRPQPAGDPVPPYATIAVSRHDTTRIDAAFRPVKAAPSAAVTRAMLVEKIRREIVEISQSLEFAEDYDTRVRGVSEFAGYTTVGVCNRHSDLCDKLCVIKTTKKPNIIMLACQIASRCAANSKALLPQTFYDAHKRYGSEARTRLNQR
jgi:hypothetical protein